MSLLPSAAARKENGPKPQGLNVSDEADNGEDEPRPMHSDSLKDLDKAVKSRPYLTVDNRLPSMFNPEHDGLYQPFSRPTREVKRTEKGQIFWQTQRKQQFLNQGHYRDIINLKISHLDPKRTLHNSEIEVKEGMASLSRMYQDFFRQFEEHEKIDDPLFIRTHDETMQMQKRVNQWLQDRVCRDDVSEANSHVPRNSQRSSKSRHSVRSRMSNSSLEEVMKNKIKLAELELRAQFVEQEKS